MIWFVVLWMSFHLCFERFFFFSIPTGFLVSPSFLCSLLVFVSIFAGFCLIPVLLCFSQMSCFNCASCLFPSCVTGCPNCFHLWLIVCTCTFSYLQVSSSPYIVLPLQNHPVLILSDILLSDPSFWPFLLICVFYLFLYFDKYPASNSEIRGPSETKPRAARLVWP